MGRGTRAVPVVEHDGAPASGVSVGALAGAQRLTRPRTGAFFGAALWVGVVEGGAVALATRGPAIAMGRRWAWGFAVPPEHGLEDTGGGWCRLILKARLECADGTRAAVSQGEHFGQRILFPTVALLAPRPLGYLVGDNFAADLARWSAPPEGGGLVALPRQRGVGQDGVWLTTQTATSQTVRRVIAAYGVVLVGE